MFPPNHRPELFREPLTARVPTRLSPKQQAHRHGEPAGLQKQRPMRAAWGHPPPKPRRECRAQSPQSFPVFERYNWGFNVTHDSNLAIQPADPVVFLAVDRYQLGHRFAALSDDQRLARGADLFHQGKTACLEFSSSNCLHGHSITYMVI